MIAYYVVYTRATKHIVSLLFGTGQEAESFLSNLAEKQYAVTTAVFDADPARPGRLRFVGSDTEGLTFPLGTPVLPDSNCPRRSHKKEKAYPGKKK